MSDFRTGMSGGCMSIVCQKTGPLPKHIFVKPGNGKSFTKYIPERTCKMFHDHNWQCGYGQYGIYCSECKEFVPEWDVEKEIPVPNYCPNCGAKVIK